MNDTMQTLFNWLHVDTLTEFWWVVFGLAGQLLFTCRFLVQWIASERERRSVIPIAFWYFSLGGGLVLFTYALYRADPVFVLGQSLGVVIYARNLWLIHAEKRGV
ncbi:lipid-A-disaccharide synthase N-terminal domain-containing protein [Psychromarinibacter sp. S121]|uniref:lipid-A-disaccharide synthase N-terminal domain-containing protein n=1 Tax=Psychromarinibacter sp. S121 TaxID=3415127 RepID=UPI003C7E1B64